MIIALGADHAGYLLKETNKVSQAVVTEEANVGILICGTGIGMCITANKIKGIRAAQVNDVESAQLSRLHNDANILCLSGRNLPEDEALKIVETWLNTSFEGGRHQGRINLISQLTGL